MIDHPELPLFLPLRGFLRPIFTMISAMASPILPSSFSTVFLGSFTSPIGIARFERLQLSDDDFDHLISSDLELVGAFAPINSKASGRLAESPRSRH